jgi:hypothetical protein
MLKRHLVFFLLIWVLGLFLVACQRARLDTNDNDNSDNQNEPTEDDGELINIEGVGTFAYDASEVTPLRDDLFIEGHFSIFAILVHLAENNEFTMTYHFDENMNTYVIDDINGIAHWWYYAFYDGGWREHSVYRMDHYPYKEGITIRFYKGNEETIEAVYETYREEVLRFNVNGGKIIIPEVIIDGSSTSHTFYDVEVTAHNLRDDIYQDGVITAIDVIMTLADLGEITYELQWYDSIGSAEIVRSYWVHAINDDVQHGTTGFVYEAGNWDYYLFDGNHIHIPSDTRIINSPEYVRYFWIGLFETP